MIFQRILPHYRIGFFKKLIRTFPSAKIIYGQPYKNETLKNESMIDTLHFQQCRNLYFDKTGKVFLSGIYSMLFRQRPRVIISVFNTGNLNIAMLFMLRFVYKYKLILWSFGYDPVRGFNPEKNSSDKVRLYYSQKADAVLFYWKNGLDKVAEYSKRKDHYFVAPNTLDTDKLTELRKQFEITGKQKIKGELGIDTDYHFIYVGRLIADKQADLLLKAFKIVEDKNENCSLTIIGDGPERSNLERLKDELDIKKIFFAGEITDDNLTGKWIFASDAFIMPGRLGLSVVHSFCFGTPVISQSKDYNYHGEGIGYLHDNLNGILVPDGDTGALASAMIKIVIDKDFSAALRKNAIQTTENECSVQNMISGFKNAIEYVSNTAH